jgi:DNA-binding MarR family transcriptional regulator
MARRSAAQTQAARDAWRALFDAFMLTLPERQAIQGEHGLTPNDSRALYSLDRKAGRPIGALAKQWNCDPSTATWVVDRLERAGLAERSSSPDDRRVKLVTLTAKGAKMIDALDAVYMEPPEGMSEISADELLALRATLDKVIAAHRRK